MNFPATCFNWKRSLLLLHNLIFCILRIFSEESLSHKYPDDQVTDFDDNDEIKMIKVMMNMR